MSGRRQRAALFRPGPSVYAVLLQSQVTETSRILPCLEQVAQGDVVKVGQTVAVFSAGAATAASAASERDCPRSRDYLLPPAASALCKGLGMSDLSSPQM